MSNALEKYYSSLQNVVLRDGNGNPSIFVRHPKQKSSDFFSLLPDHTHPAFIVNGVEDPAVLIGKYEGSILPNSNALYSLPFATVDTSNDYSSKGEGYYLPKVRAFPNATEMTVADYGLLALIAQKYLADGGSAACEGNGPGGSDGKYEPMWRANLTWAVGSKCVYGGWQFMCIKAVTSEDISDASANHYSLDPMTALDHWKRLSRVGGVPAPGYNDSSCLTLTGSGPLEWYFCHDITKETDIVGNTCTWMSGIRMVDGEIQIQADNNAADPTATIIGNDAAWLAIKPSSSDSSYELVVPGTETNTVHFAYLNNRITAVGRTLTSGEISSTNRYTYFGDIAVDNGTGGTLPYVPTILYELGLIPIPGIGVRGLYCWIRTQGTMQFTFGGHYSDAWNGFPGFNAGEACPTGIWRGSARPRVREVAS